MPGTVFFDPPAFLQDIGNLGDPTILRVYRSRDDVLSKSFRKLEISVRAVGYSNAPAGQGHFVRIDQQALGRELLALFTERSTNGSGVCHLSGVTNCVLGGLPAVRLGFQVELPYERHTLYGETYWALFESNRAVTVTLAAHSREGLPSLRGCLPGIRITKKQ